MKQELLKVAKVLSSRLVDTETLANPTNASTVGGISIMTISSLLLQMPEPNAQVAGAVLMVIGFGISMYKENKKG